MTSSASRMPLDQSFKNNRAWAKRQLKKDPELFQRLLDQQTPQVLWIGCSDSRVPANEIVGLPPGELFVHRNVANLVIHTDLNCLSVVQFAVEILKIKHIVVCGHYGCAGIRAIIEKTDLGLVNNWLQHVADVKDKYGALFQSLGNPEERAKRLCELNIAEQARNVSQLTVVLKAWARRQPLAIHGWVYDLKDGILKDLLEKPVVSPVERVSYSRSFPFLSAGICKTEINF